MDNVINLAFIGVKSQWFYDRAVGHLELKNFSSPKELIGSHDGIILNPESQEQQLHWLKALRSSKEYSHLLIVTLSSIEQLEPESKILVDHCWESLDAELKNIRVWQEQISLFHYSDLDKSLEQTLIYLWSNPQRKIEPLADWRAPHAYCYPILDCFSSNNDDSFLTLGRMRSQNLIKRQNLVDRVRVCPECKKSHLSFVDICPNCKSLDIEQQKSLHCFNCGFVGPESNFKKNGVLVCPNCDTRLRHIGVDYDRPFEQFHCRSCSELFIEAEVTARCMECNHRSTPEQLNLEVIYNYELSEKGSELCLYGEKTASLDKLLEASLIPYEVFIFSANWLNKLAKRSEEQPYSLMALKIINASTVVAKQGYAQAQIVIQSLSQKVRDLIRSTDLATRHSSDLYLLLLPSTDFKGAKVLKEKIINELEIIQSGRDSALKIGIALYSSSENGVSEQEISQVITMLVNEIQE